MTIQRKYTLAEIYTAHGQVVLIALSLDGTVTLDDVISEYGPPTSVGGFYGQGEAYWRNVTILHDDGIAIFLQDLGWPLVDYWRLKPSDIVEEILFFVPDTLPQFAGDIPGFLPITLGESYDVVAAGLVPWNGYEAVTLRSIH
jgi:hypothetical protein